MTGFFPLLRLQLLSRFADLKPRNLKTQLREKKGRTIGMIIAYIFLAVYLGGFLIVSENFILNALLQMGIPDLLLNMAVTLTMAGTLIVSFFFIMSALYFGRDAAFIAALPVKPRTVLAAKLTQVWVSEAGFSALIILPACIMYGIKAHPDFLFYARMILVALCAPVLPIVIIAFVSTLLIRVSALWKRRDLIATVGGILFLVLYMLCAMRIGSISGGGESQDLIINFMQSNSARIDSMTKLFPPAAWAAKGLQGDWAYLLLFLGVCAAGIALAVWLIGLWYQKLSLLQSEASTTSRKKSAKRASFTGSSAFKANCLREIRLILRVPSYATNVLPIAFMPVMMVVMMYFIVSSSMAKEGESLPALLASANPTLILPIITAVMAYMAGMNPALSTAVSREGRGHDFMNALPVNARTLVLSKFAVGYGLTLIGVLLSAVIIAVFFPAFAVQAFLAFILCALFCYATSAFALARDVKHPRLNWVTEQEAIKQNFGVLIGMLVGWAILITLGVLSYFLIKWGVGTYAYFAVIAAILALLSLLMHRHLMHTTDKYYCQG